MSITLEQLQFRREARNPAQWDWRVLDTECHAAGNSPILNLCFDQVAKPARSNRGVRRMFTKARLRQRRIHGLNKWNRRSVRAIRGMQVA
jgi:hypothetical protein